MSKDAEAVALGEYLDEVERVVFDLRDRVKVLEERQDSPPPDEPQRVAAALAELYKGSFDPGATYLRGHMVTEGGSLWLAIADATGKPGRDASWRLIVRAGRDGRDRR